MQTLARFCFLVALHSFSSVLVFYHRFLRLSLLLMDLPSTFKFIAGAGEFGCGFVLLGGYFSRLFNLIGFILILTFSIRFLKYSHLLNEFIPQNHPPRSAKIQALERDSLKPKPFKKGRNAEDGDEENVEDELFDAMALRKLVKFERQRFQAACAEIEKERVAASSAAEEAMAMILRLQSEKSSIEIQANQFRRMVEQKQEYDDEVIESLRWTVAQHESQKYLLEEQLMIYREKLREFLSDDEIEQLDGSDDTVAKEGFLDFSIEYDVVVDDDNHNNHAASVAAPSLEKESQAGLLSSQG